MQRYKRYDVGDHIDLRHMNRKDNNSMTVSVLDCIVMAAAIIALVIITNSEWYAALMLALS